MKSISQFIIMAIITFCGHSAFSQAVFNITDSAVTMSQIIDSIKLESGVLTDTSEGGKTTKFALRSHFWTARATQNMSSTNNMFASYFSALNSDVQARFAGTCGTSGFHGAWQCIGPDTLDKQAMGYVECLWADPGNANYLLAGTYGGVFKTTNQGKSWKCITDNAPIANGVNYVSSIIVDPANTNNIYFGTTSEFLVNVRVQGQGGIIYGSAMYKSTDGGSTWQQELVGTTSSPGTSFDRVQKLYFTPSGNNIIAFRQNKIFIRPKSGSTWEEITSTTNPLSSGGSGVQWRDLAFIPGDANADTHFFIASANGEGGGKIAAIFEVTKSSGIWNIATITTGSSFITMGVDSCLRMEMSIPDNSSLFTMFLDRNGESERSSLAVYNLNTSTWTLIQDNLSGVGVQAHQHTGELLVSPQKVKLTPTGSANQYNIYIGGLRLFQSFDGGSSFQAISKYDGPETHADIRNIILYSPTNSHHGKDDWVFFATDGGVGVKVPGRDPAITTESTSDDMSGRGLACATLWNVATSEVGGLITAGAQHQGLFSYQPDLAMPWYVDEFGDGAITVFDEVDKTKSWGTQWTTQLYESSPSGSRKIKSWAFREGLPNDPEKSTFSLPFWVDRGNNMFNAQRQLYQRTSSGWNSLSATLGLPAITFIWATAMSPYETSSPLGYVIFKRSDDPTVSAQSKMIYYRNPTYSQFFQGKNLPAIGAQPTDVTLDPKNPDRVWISMGGINTGTPTTTTQKVYYSTDGGTNWVDVSAGLPFHVPVTSIIFQEASNNVYCATDVGIFKCDFTNYNPSATSGGKNTSVQWECFNKAKNPADPDFPCTYVTDMTINYCTGQLLASTYGRSMWATDILNNTYPEGAGETITANTTWNNTRYLTGNIRILSGKTLTIQKNSSDVPVINMPKNSRIIIEPNAQLIVDGARITNSCDQQWEGIEVRGNVGQVQTQANQGFLFIKNSVIEHAKTAIKNWDGANFATTGGIIKVDNSKFLNNSTSVSIQHYSYNSAWSAIYKNYAANFTNDTFDINNEFKGGSASPFNEHVSLNHVDGVRFNGCQFLNRNQTPSLKGTGVGIKARDAGFYVRKLCNLSICTDKCRFKGLTFGIYTEATNNTLYGASIDQAVFDSCTFGIKINKQDFVQVTRDSFMIGRGKSGDVSGTECFKNVGLFVTGTCSPIVEDNIFAGVTAPGIENLGVIMQSTGEADKQVYHNSFTSLGRGILAINNNKDRNITTSPFPPTSPAWFTGLRILCNSFQSNSKDIHVDANGSIVNAAWKINEGIAAYQGDPSKPAGNTFPTSGITHIDNTGNFINYFYASSQPNSNPANITYCAKYSINVNPSCTSRNGTFDLPLGNSQTNGIKNVGVAKRVGLLSALSQYESLLDNGDTEAMKSYINGKTLADSATVRTTLLGLSPYLSDELLKHVANANVLHPGVFAKILIANPDVMRDGHLLEFFIDNYPGLIATEQIADIEDSYDNTTARTTKEGQISTLTAEMQLAATQVITNMLLDTVAAPVDSMVAWLNFVGTVNSEYAKASYYAGLGDYTEADNILNDLPTKYTLTLDEETEYSQYMQMWTAIKDIYTDGRTFEQMTTPELTAFTTLHDASIPNGRINVITGTITGIPLSPQWKIPCNLTKYVGHMKQGTTQTSPSRTKANKGLQRNIEKRNVFNVYPNPATDLVTFDFRVPLTKEPVVITITNVAGQTIETFTSETNFGNIRWNTQNISSGVYMYKITTDKLLLETGRIVISK